MKIKILLLLMSCSIFYANYINGENNVNFENLENINSLNYENHILGPGDNLAFKVYGEEDTGTATRVSADGLIYLPYLENPINVTGMTLSEARDVVYSLYERDIYVNPQIYLSISDYAPKKIWINGQVGRQGSLEIPPEQKFTISQAITTSGYTRLANLKKVSLKRRSDNGDTKSFEINVDEIIKNPDAEDWVLEEGDIIYVPERRI